MKKQKTMQMAEIALMSAVLCVMAPIAIPVPVSPVPLSPATFVVYLTAALLGPKRGCISVLIYLLLGGIGLPVFAGFSGGVGVLAGPTGGYVIGYVPCALVAGFVMNCGGMTGVQRKSALKERVKHSRQPVVWNGIAMSLGTLACYAFGMAWFLIIMKGTYTVVQAFLLCVMPYLLLDSIKIVAAAAIAVPVRKIRRREGM